MNSSRSTSSHVGDEVEQGRPKRTKKDVATAPVVDTKAKAHSSEGKSVKEAPAQVQQVPVQSSRTTRSGKAK